MNLDLLKKLVKLAINNPNDNEANSAARKVCRMIAEDNYKLVGGDQVQRRPANGTASATIPRPLRHERPLPLQLQERDSRAETRNPADHNPSKADQARDRIEKSFETQSGSKALHV